MSTTKAVQTLRLLRAGSGPARGTKQRGADGATDFTDGTDQDKEMDEQRLALFREIRDIRGDLRA